VVLLTGAAGYIAGELLPVLRAAGWTVRGLDLAVGTRAGMPIAAADITRPLDPALFAGVTAVVHLAGKVHALAEVAADRAEYFRINTEGTRHVLAAAGAAGVRRFVLLSTVKAMGEGNPPDAPLRALDESAPCQPVEPYGESKLAAEQLVLHGGCVPEPVVLRLAMVYGGADAKGNLPRMFAAVRQGRFPPLPEVGNRRSMVHVADVTQAVRLALEHPAVVGEAAAQSRRSGGFSRLHSAPPGAAKAATPTPEAPEGATPTPEAAEAATPTGARAHPAVAWRDTLPRVRSRGSGTLPCASGAGGLYIVTDGQAYSTRQILDWMRTACGRPPIRHALPLPVWRALGRAGDLIGRLRGRRFVFDSDALHKLTGSAWYDGSRIQRELGFAPRHNLRGTIQDGAGAPS
jgi:nucleoside-diphosphate-sugar epimerase